MILEGLYETPVDPAMALHVRGRPVLSIAVRIVSGAEPVVWLRTVDQTYLVALRLSVSVTGALLFPPPKQQGPSR
jgi:hypothetical protein